MCESPIPNDGNLFRLQWEALAGRGGMQAWGCAPTLTTQL